jgi:hypothetical protein
MTAVAPTTSTIAREVPGADTLGGAARLFFRFPTPRLLLGYALALGAVRASLAALGYGALGLGDALVALGVAIYWPLQEWTLHAWLLHLRPRTLFGVRIDPIFARYHRYHHEHPWVLERTFLPTRVLIPLLPVNVLVWWLAAPTLGVALTGMAAMAVAALVYEWTHYLTHTPYRPRSAYYARVHKNHMLHHFRDDQAWFAFTAPWLDRVLRTTRKDS